MAEPASGQLYFSNYPESDERRLSAQPRHWRMWRLSAKSARTAAVRSTGQDRLNWRWKAAASLSFVFLLADLFAIDMCCGWSPRLLRPTQGRTSRGSW